VVGADNKIAIQPVQVDAQVGADSVVRGVKPGDRIVVAGTQAARDGATVTPVVNPVVNSVVNPGSQAPAADGKGGR